MGLIVQKYGGTSVGSVDRLRNVARRALKTQREGHRVVVVVSAMSGETNRLQGLIHAMTPRPTPREQDVILASGEQVSVGLLAMAIQTEGGDAESVMAHQCRIVTDSIFSRARIRQIDSRRIHAALARGSIPVVAGFQGVDDDGNITTLGRGGSDTSAVAIAAALKADACEIYTDVDGVYTTDPSICPAARKLDRISYEEMLELASLGAKVLQIRSVELAMKYGVPLWVRSSFNETSGTRVCAEEAGMEHVVVTGVTCDRNEAKIAVRGVRDVPGVAARLFGPLSKEEISVDLIVQNVSIDGRTDVTFTVTRPDFARAEEVVRAMAAEIGASGIETDAAIAKVSIVGLGMRSHSGVAADMFRVLASEGVNVQMISTSEIKISAVVHEGHADRAVRALHAAFGLDVAPPGAPNPADSTPSPDPAPSNDPGAPQPGADAETSGR